MLLRTLLAATLLACLSAFVSSLPTTVDLVPRFEYEVLDLEERSLTSTTSDVTLHVRDELITEGIKAGASIAQAGCGTGNALTCGVSVVGGLLFAFFAYYVSSNGARDISGFQLVTEYPPLPNCNHRCRLWNEAPEGDWRSIGNVTVNGIFHDLHYYRNGNQQGLRAYQYGDITDVLSRRQAQENDGGMVGDYRWWWGYEAAYDSFHSTSSQIDAFADDIVYAMNEDETILMCASFADSTGVLAPGLVSIGWNNQPFQFTGNMLLDDEDTCESADWDRKMCLDLLPVGMLVLVLLPHVPSRRV